MEVAKVPLYYVLLQSPAQKIDYFNISKQIIILFINNFYIFFILVEFVLRKMIKIQQIKSVNKQKFFVISIIPAEMKLKTAQLESFVLLINQLNVGIKVAKKL